MKARSTTRFSTTRFSTTRFSTTRFSTTRFSIAIAMTCACLSPALAQDHGHDQNNNHGGWLDDDQDPLSPKVAPAPEPVTGPVKQDELTPAERKKRGRLIDRNYSDAQKTYGEVLAMDPTRPLERRIKNNERIVTDFRARIARATKTRRQAQVDLYNRTFFLKAQLDKKQVTADVYDKLILAEEEKFKRSEANYKMNVVAWQKEVDEALTRLKDLRAKHRLLEAQRPRRPKPRRAKGGSAPGHQGSQLVGTLRQRLARLGQFRRRHTMTFVHPRTLGMTRTAAVPAVLELVSPLDEE